MGSPSGSRVASLEPAASSAEEGAVAYGVRDVPAAVIEMPCQIVRTVRRIVYRLLSWTPWQGVFLRLVESLALSPVVLSAAVR